MKTREISTFSVSEAFVFFRSASNADMPEGGQMRSSSPNALTGSAPAYEKRVDAPFALAVNAPI